MAENERHAETSIELNPEQIWPLITDARAFHGLGIPHTYDEFDRFHACPGMAFERVSLHHGKRSPQYIVDWEPPRLFSFGHSPTEWDFWFQLQPVGQATTVRFARRFAKPDVLERLLGALRPNKVDDYQQLAEKTIRRVVQACETYKQTGRYGVAHPGGTL